VLLFRAFDAFCYVWETRQIPQSIHYEHQEKMDQLKPLGAQQARNNSLYLGFRLPLAVLRLAS